MKLKTSAPVDLVASLRIERWALADMNPAAYNPRVMLDHERQGLEGSLDEFGLVDPIIVNARTKNIVGGHQRYFLLRARGITHTDVSVVDLTPEKEEALNLILNNPHAQGSFVQDRMKAMLAKLRKASFPMEKMNLDLLESHRSINSANDKVTFTARITVTERAFLEDTLHEIKKQFKIKQNGDALIRMCHHFNGTQPADLQ